MDDFTLIDEGSILLLQPNTPEAEAWSHEHIGINAGYQPYWPTVVIEGRFLAPVLQGILDEGLTVSR